MLIEITLDNGGQNPRMAVDIWDIRGIEEALPGGRAGRATGCVIRLRDGGMYNIVAEYEHMRDTVGRLRRENPVGCCVREAPDARF